MFQAAFWQQRCKQLIVDDILAEPSVQKCRRGPGRGRQSSSGRRRASACTGRSGVLQNQAVTQRLLAGCAVLPSTPGQDEGTRTGAGPLGRGGLCDPGEAPWCRGPPRQHTGDLWTTARVLTGRRPPAHRSAGLGLAREAELMARTGSGPRPEPQPPSRDHVWAAQGAGWGPTPVPPRGPAAGAHTARAQAPAASTGDSHMSCHPPPAPQEARREINFSSRACAQTQRN